MSSYHLNNWVLVKFQRDDGDFVTVVLGGISGGYLGGDAWRLSSPIESVEKSTNLIEVKTESGSFYTLSKGREQLHLSFIGIWKQLQDEYGERVELVKLDDYMKERRND